MRLAIICSHPIQYFAPLFRKLAGEPEIELTVFYCSQKSAIPGFDPGFGQTVQWDIPLLEGYSYRFLRNWRHSGQISGFFSLINPGIIREILSQPWDAVIVHGYMHATIWLALLAAKVKGILLFIRGESNLLNSRPLWKQFLKNIVLRCLFRIIDAGLYIGSHNRDFYRVYGMNDARLYFTPYSVDNKFFEREAERLKQQKSILRDDFQLHPDYPVILFCGKLIPKKQPLLLLQAFSSVRENYPCSLLFAGDGMLRDQIEGKVKRDNIPDVRVTGFLNQSEISRAYAAADILVLPSAWEETWGLVMNEAMNFGLPIIATDRVGGAADLVREGENGHIIPYQDPQALARALEGLVKDGARRRRYGEESLKLIQSWGLNETVAGIKAACFQDHTWHGKISPKSL